MNPTAIGIFLWMVSVPVFLMLWLLNRRKSNKLTADTRQAADLHQAALALGAAEHDATKAKYARRRMRHGAGARNRQWASRLTPAMKPTLRVAIWRDFALALNQGTGELPGFVVGSHMLTGA